MNPSPLSTVNGQWAGTASLLAGAVMAAWVIIVVVSRERSLGIEAPAFFVLWALGLTMSILAGFRDQVTVTPAQVGWTYGPLMALGILAFVMLPGVPVANLLGWLKGYRSAFDLLAVVIIAKWMLAHLHFLRRA